MNTYAHLQLLKPRRTQRGVIAIFFSIMMLIMITLLVLAAYTASTTNLRAAGNVQIRQQAIAAANKIIEDTLASDFTALTTAQNGLVVDLYDDGVSPLDDIVVDLTLPVCVRARPVVGDAGSSTELMGSEELGGTVGSWYTIWEIEATAREPVSGVSVRVVKGAKKLLTDAQKTVRCA